NKEEILRRIFRTEPFTLLTQRLKEKKQTAEQDYQTEEQTLQRLIAEIPGMLPEREQSELFQVLNRESYNVHQVLAGLENEKNFYEKEVVRCQEEERRAGEAY